MIQRPDGEGNDQTDGPPRRGPKPRRVRFDWDEPFEPLWTRQPELALCANAVSMLMPHAEPYVVDAVARACDDLDPELAVRARTFVRQERQHHVQHRRFNDRLLLAFPGLRHIDRLSGWTFGLLRRRTSHRFGLAFAAGFETVAFTAARWTAARHRSLFAGANQSQAALFLWHLAEEVEHKAVAHDVYEATGGGRLRRLWAMTVSMLLLAFFTVAGTLSMMWSTRRIFHPMAHVRMTIWSISFLFDLLPAMAVAVLRDHHPDRLVDPPFYELWLAEFDIGEQPAPVDLDAAPGA